MSSPKSIFTAPEDFLPAAPQSQPRPRSPPLRPSASQTNRATPTPSPRSERPGKIDLSRFRTPTNAAGAWVQSSGPEPLPSPSGLPSTLGHGYSITPRTTVPSLSQFAGQKRSFEKYAAESSKDGNGGDSGGSTLTGPQTAPASKHRQHEQPPSKKTRTRNLHPHLLDRFELPFNQFDPAAATGQPPSPLFFSHSKLKRPLLPPRFSSGEAGDRMLRQADAEESKVRTVKLARAPYSGSSPPTIGLPSYRSTPSSSFLDTASPESEGSKPDSQQLLHHVGVVELLEQDPRPTLIVDLGDAANYLTTPLRLTYANSALRSNPALHDAVQGRGTDSSPRTDPYRGFTHFKSWILSAAVNGESLDVCLPAFVHGGVSWSCSTLRKRLRVASASAAMLSPLQGAGSPASRSIHMSTGGTLTSSGSFRSMHQEPTDYFGGAVAPMPTKPATIEEPTIVPSIELQEASAPASLAANTPLTDGAGTNGPIQIPHRQPSPADLIANHASLTNESVLSAVAASNVDPFYSPSQDDIGFFDWTRLPYSDNLPRHIRFARSIDWASTSLGPIELWPPDLRQMCNLIMASPHPAAMYWGEDLVAIYNEAYVLLAGQKHPRLMGQCYKDAWSEIWDEVKNVFANARQTGQATMKDDDCLFIKRSNFLEETYFSWSIIPMVGGDGTVTGLYNPAFEKTRRKIVERRMLTLREVGERTATARDVKGFWNAVSEALDCNEHDTPFVMLYSVSEDSDSDSSSIHSSSILGTKQCYLEGSLGVPKGHAVAPEQMELKTSMEGLGPMFREVMKTDKPVLLRVAGTEEEEVIIGSEFDGSVVTHESNTEKGPEIPAEMLDGIQWRGFGDSCRAIVICPIHPTTGDSILGFLVLGINPRRPYDDDYSLFIQLLSRQLATSLASVVLFEEEIRRGQRAARLAALDRIELSEQLAARTQEARDSDLRFARMAELSPAALFIANSQGQIIFSNDTWYTITRVPKDSTSTDRWIDSVCEEDQTRVRELWAELVEQCKPFTAEFRFKAQWHDRNGHSSDTWVLFSAYPETYSESLPGIPKGKLKSVFGCLTDVSQQKWAEDFNKRKMEQAVELKRQTENFIDITSHEVRNPLSAILQCADEIKTRLGDYKKMQEETQTKEIDPELVDDSIEAAQTIMFCAQHQKQIVDDVLTLSKLDSRMLMVTPIDVQPVSVVERALKMHENEIRNADIDMSLVVDESYTKLGVDWVRLDPQRVLQVLINLTGNAIKFTAGRETRRITVTLAASKDRPNAHIKDVNYFSANKPESEPPVGSDWGTGEDVYIQFAVQDTGRGLNIEEKKMLFMRFSQASPRTHIQYGGSGLGLFISRELTELQGGKIGVASEAGKGSTFAFYVLAKRSLKPVDTEAQFPALVKTVTIDPKGKRGSASDEIKSKDFATIPNTPTVVPKHEDIYVLIVEDNLVNQKVLQKSLKNVGFKVSVANHGGECLERLKESQLWKANSGSGNALSVVLMDQEMPIMDGLQCTKKIREWEAEDKLARHVPIIGVTANARAEQIQTLMVAGMDDVVSKPFRIPDIVPKIEGMVIRFPTSEE